MNDLTSRALELQHAAHELHVEAQEHGKLNHSLL